MSIKRYIVNGGSVMLREDESYEHGQCLWVRDSDYNKIQSQLTALTSQLESVVAENAASNDRLQKLIQIINNADNNYCMCGDAMESHAHGGCGHPTGMFDYHYNKWLESENETPATDAFLAEVRASGVDAACLKISNAIPKCCQDELIGLDAAATICGDLAAKIRQGGAV